MGKNISTIPGHQNLIKFFHNISLRFIVAFGFITIIASGDVDDDNGSTDDNDVILTGEWTWVSGDNTPNQPGVYGTKGTGSISNIPSARSEGVSWIDSSGNLWLFGGNDGISENKYDIPNCYNDLWKYEPSTGEWTWVSGDNTPNQPAVYGTKGTGSISNIPSARSGSVSWIDSSGNLWLFGGQEYADYYGDVTLLNDLWKYEPSTGEWTWVSGDDTLNQPGIYGTKGTGSISNMPGAREGSTSWIDSSGNLWLFGGSYGLNDLWKYEPSTEEWTWVSGDNTKWQSGIYGTKGTGSTSNKPGERKDSISWIDSSGNLWLFGGNCGPDTLNDLWKYEPSTGEWSWVSGDNITNQSGVYGTKGTGSTSNKPRSRSGSVAWIDSSDNLWLFGGNGYDENEDWGSFNDLLKYEPSTGKWIWVSGDNITNQSGVYGTKGTGSTSNKPRSRSGSVAWIDSSDNLWLFGGLVYDANGYWGSLNDLFKYEP